MDDELISVITPVYNRRRELEKCLKSLVGQTYGNFEAIIIDDCSTIEIRDIVDGMNDARFRYIRNEKNGGPYNARTLGWETCRGDYIVNLDSDWEALPWMLQRIVHYFKETPEADAVTGVFLRSEDSRVVVRVRDGKRLVTPRDVATLPPVSDCIAGLRRRAIDAWLERSREYFALEAHAWLTFSLKYSQLYVDEPWALYHTDSSNRVTPLLVGKNPRQISDCLLFLRDYDEVLRTVPRKDIDDFLIRITKIFLRNRHWEGFRECLSYMRARKMDVQKVFVGLIISGVFFVLKPLLTKSRKTEEIVWI
ncbi:MAG: glycosyltransferase family 2 protein [Syntrophorhabdales bacterium]